MDVVDDSQFACDAIREKRRNFQKTCLILQIRRIDPAARTGL